MLITKTGDERRRCGTSVPLSYFGIVLPPIPAVVGSVPDYGPLTCDLPLPGLALSCPGGTLAPFPGLSGLPFPIPFPFPLLPLLSVEGGMMTFTESYPSKATPE